MRTYCRILSLITLLTAAGIWLVSCHQKSAGPGGEASGQLPDVVDYNFDIRPILSDKCYTCHGPDANKRKAGLRLDVAENAYKALKDNPDAHALVPGHPDRSEVYLRISSKDTAEMMPPPESNLKLTDFQISLIKKWIKQGAKYERHWAFTPPEKEPLPAVKEKQWPKNAIDYFVLSKLEKNGLKHSPEADKERLLKRVSLDITGLPPTLAMMDRFLQDSSAGAYEKIVDELLQSKAYGERMAVYWMDVARYADSYGYQDDNIRTQWPWRDWVIKAFNENMPYDRFVTWQLAGDLLPNATPEQILATAFLRNHKYTEEGGVIPEEYRVSYVVDKTNTFGKGILSVTVQCANCHDHKYDPISQKDYFSLYAFFNNSYEEGYEGDVSTSKPAKTPILRISHQEIKDLLTFIHDPDTSSLMVSVMGEREPDSMRKTYLLARGNYETPTVEVQPSTPAAIMPFDTTRYPRNRLGLAEWTFSRKNPLTARSFVNHMWQELFGRGIVKTSNDFGMQGELPSHPELLDWLAVDFMDHGWDMKRLIKTIVLSSTYRQSAAAPREQVEQDPDNKLLARGPRVRLPAEFIRDLVLSSSGLLVNKIGGPSVKPYQPEGLWESATSGRGVLATYVQDHGESLYRRGLYSFIKLTVPPPSMLIFDASNRDVCEVQRLRTNTPLQALVMMNDPTVLEASRVLAANLLSQGSGQQQLVTAFRRIVCRRPSAKEVKLLNDYWQDRKKYFATHAAEARKLIQAGEYPQRKDVQPVALAAFMQVVNTIYNMDETITKT
ncbi:PSD1 and planctomycete cytochrome C domain-containing protein [Compostibacter hankyongensis]|uniref:DUF1553 domain-containing protein n=1 Tax=Compostibacter hankyongensis TaxID=1007089 RepID=A0ABP8G139_9BACT